MSRTPSSRPGPSLGHLLRYGRCRAGLSQTQLADLLNVSQALVSLWESDRREPEIALLLAACRLLRLRVDSAVRLAAGGRRRWRRWAPDLGARLREERLRAGCRLVEVGRATRIAPRRLSEIEAGRQPTADEVRRLCAWLEIPAESLVGTSLDVAPVLPRVPSSQRCGPDERRPTRTTAAKDHRSS